MDFSLKNNNVVLTHEKVSTVFADNQLVIDGFEINFPGEYEKSAVLVETFEAGADLGFILITGGRRIVYIPSAIDNMTSDMITKVGDVDVLIVPAHKALQGSIEKIEPKVVIPYGDTVSAFLGAFGQAIEPREKFVLKVADFDAEQIVFGYLSE